MKITSEALSKSRFTLLSGFYPWQMAMYRLDFFTLVTTFLSSNTMRNVRCQQRKMLFSCYTVTVVLLLSTMCLLLDRQHIAVSENKKNGERYRYEFCYEVVVSLQYELQAFNSFW
uniref:Uncharacterized protein n=1 Tax=Glossina pallidipes TaxID=7398 RepID=A0A1B0A3C4_GLOPL